MRKSPQAKSEYRDKTERCKKPWAFHATLLCLCAAWGFLYGQHACAQSSAAQRWIGQNLSSVRFEGVRPERLESVATEFRKAEGKPLDAATLRKMLRDLYATGLYETVQAEAQPEQNGIGLIFRGKPQLFIGTVSVLGANGSTLNAQLARAGRLSAGTRFTEARLRQAEEQMRTMLADNGFHEPTLTHDLVPHPQEQLIDIHFHVLSGTQARVGTVDVVGETGMTPDQFRRHAHLAQGARIDRETNNRALSSILRHYQKQGRFEAEIKLISEKYDPATHLSSFHFSVNRGPVVQIVVEGAHLSADKLKHVIPVFEEGTVDEDLLNEGSRSLRNYYQRLGYFDAKVTHDQKTESNSLVTILYRVTLGPQRRVAQVSVAGNHYFDAATLKELLSVRAADLLDRHGAFSQTLTSADIAAIENVYRNNGFADVKVVAEAETPAPPAGKKAGHGKIVPLAVTYRITEGLQMRVGSVRIDGNRNIASAQLIPLMNTAEGQLFSPQYLSGDRDALLTHYLSRGFTQASVTVSEQPRPADPDKVDVLFHVSEGAQTFVRKVLLSGLEMTRPETVKRAIVLHPGDPLNQTAIEETQRNLYDFALFNEVETSVQNPLGAEPQKTVLVQVAEARRWALTYGFGFEAQTGTPQNNCGTLLVIGEKCNPNGKASVSPRVILDITRNNLWGREQSASLRGTYGLLEQKIDLLYQVPHLAGGRNFAFTFSGGYANSKDVTTYVASRLQGGIRLTENFQTPGSLLSKANTLIWEYNFRRVKVASESLQVSPLYLKPLSTAVRVAGPSLTWVRDTRNSPLDAHRGSYLSFQEFVSMNDLGAEVGFNRMDIQNSNFFSFGKDRFVLARNTRYGQERAFHSPQTVLLPLPERLYAGGATSLRGFPQNGAGPRDPETGYPIGGAGTLINSTELRLPSTPLPWVGNTVSFVLFHDMGNVFTNAGDAWESAVRIHQPNRDACKVLTPPDTSTNPPTPPNPTGPIASTGRQGQCNFNYFSHTPGLGVRYHTPVGPIRFDFGYNLNPPIYPVNINYSSSTPYANQHVGQGNHFNFFFSLGQTF